MKYKIPIQIAVFLLFLLLMVMIFSGYTPRSEVESLDKFEPDGIEMKYVAFNKNNQKSLEISCSESRKQEEDKTLMRNIKAVIFKKGDLDRDIFISADNGYVSNNTSNIFIENNARITSEDIQISSQNFRIKAKYQLFTEKPVHYQAKGLEGIARKGLEYFMKTNLIKLFDTEGTYDKNGQKTAYKTDQLWIIDRKKTLIFQENTEIKDQKSLLKSDRLMQLFDKDFKILKKVKSFNKSYFFNDNREKNETLEVKSKVLETSYTNTGALKRTVCRKNVVIFLKDPNNLTEITSRLTIIKYKFGTGQISEIKILPPGKVKNQGKNNFEISADKIVLKFKKGQLSRGEATTKCRFRIDKYHGNSDQMAYIVEKNEIQLTGEKSTIKKDKNTFLSKNFTINTRQNTLTSAEGIESIINPEKKNALFSTDSIFVNAKKIEIFDKENRVVYKDDARLQQNETILNTDQLEIRGENNLSTNGNTHLVFKNKEEEITIMGENLTFDPENKTITIKDKGIIKSKDRMLKGKLIKILFDENNELDQIQGEKEIQFTQDKIQGSAEKVNWEFKKELMRFSKTAQIKSAGGGTTKGDELMLDLKTSKITILSEESKRSETIIE